MYRKIIKFFFNHWYKWHPPEMTHPRDWSEGKLARVGNEEDGSFFMAIQGDKYPFPGFPRGHVLMSSVGKLKHELKMLCNETRGKMQSFMDEHKYQMAPPEHMSHAVRELWNGFKKLEDAEVTEDMKERIRLYRDVLCFWLEEDDAYRFRFQWLLEHLDMKKMKLTKQDKYFFRAKYFKVEHRKKILGMDFEAYDY